MADNLYLLDEWLERVEGQCLEAEKQQNELKKTNPDPPFIMITSTAPPSLWRARIKAIRELMKAEK